MTLTRNMFGLFKKKKDTTPNEKQEHHPSAPQALASPDSSTTQPSQRRSSSFGSFLGGALSTATAVGKLSLTTAASVGNTVAVKAKKVGKKTGLALKDGIIDASLFVDTHAKRTIDYLQDKTTEGSACNLGLSQLNVFRRQAKEGVVYTMNLPQNASRDMRVFQLLPHGKVHFPPPLCRLTALVVTNYLLLTTTTLDATPLMLPTTPLCAD